MLKVSLQQREPFTMLCLGAHCDDIEIGAGGFVMKLLDERPSAVHVCWVVFSSNPERAQEARASAEEFLRNAARSDIRVLSHRDGYLPQVWSEVKDYFEALKGDCNPDLILTHARDDRHQDHRVICDLAWNTYRNHLIMEYEIPKYDADLGQPGVYVSISEEIARRKVSLILKHFRSQSGKHWFTEDALLGLMRLRGIESGSTERYAESFYGRKLVF